MRILILVLLLVGCNTNNRISNIEDENKVLKQKVDSLTNKPFTIADIG